MADTFYIAGDCIYKNADFHIAVYIDIGGYATYGEDRPLETHGEEKDPFWSLGVDTETWTYELQQAEIGLLERSRIKFGLEGAVESVWGWDIVGGAWVDLIAGGGGAHNRLHNMASALDHQSANKWKMWYADGAGPPAAVQELALGVAGTIIKSAGPVAPPTFTTHTLDNAFDHGKVIDGATSSANAVKIGDGADAVYIYAVGGDVFIEVVGGGTLKLKGGNLEADNLEKVYDAVWN